MLAENGGNVDLLLTDVVLPGGSGIDLAERVRTLDPSVRVIFMSGYADWALPDERVRSSAADFMEKPFTQDGLASKVREALDRSPAAED